MNINLTAKICYVLVISLVLTSCSMTQSFLQTPSPTLKVVTKSTSTPTPTLLEATFNDNLCELKDSFILEGELCYTDGICTTGKANSQIIEGSPSYPLGLMGYSSNGNVHYLSIWVRHNLSPKPNEMQTLPDQFNARDVIIYTSNMVALQNDLEPVRLKLHVIPAQISEPSDDPLVYCDYAVEEIKLK